MDDFDLHITEAVKDIAAKTFSTNKPGSIPYTSEYELQAELFKRLENNDFAVTVEWKTDGKRKFLDMVLFDPSKGRYSLTTSGIPDRFDVNEFLALIELKLFWLSMSKERIYAALQKDIDKLLQLNLKSLKRYVIAFDYLGKLNEGDVKSLKGDYEIIILYVDVKNQKLHFL